MTTLIYELENVHSVGSASEIVSGFFDYNTASGATSYTLSTSGFPVDVTVSGPQSFNPGSSVQIGRSSQGYLAYFTGGGGSFGITTSYGINAKGLALGGTFDALTLANLTRANQSATVPFVGTYQISRPSSILLMTDVTKTSSFQLTGDVGLVSTVPLPSSLMLFVLGVLTLAGLLVWRRNQTSIRTDS